VGASSKNTKIRTTSFLFLKQVKASFSGSITENAWFAIDNEGMINVPGRVLVNCSQGVSRSATIVVAFLMLKRGMTAQAGLRHLRSVRNVWPNIGFLRQLAKLDEQLRQKRCEQGKLLFIPEPLASIGA